MSKQKTLHQYLKDFSEKNVVEHVVRAKVEEDGAVTFRIYPAFDSGESLDFEVSRNPENYLKRNRRITKAEK